MDLNTNAGSGKNLCLFIGCALLALLATSISLGIATYAGWQRGGWLEERMINVAFCGVAVLYVHLLPMRFGLLRASTQIFAGPIWVIGIIVVLYGQTTFFLLSNQHAGDQRASTSKITIQPRETEVPGRTLTDIAQDVTKVSGDLASADARTCAGECTLALKVRRAVLAAKLAALNTEASETKRREIAEDRRNEQVDRNEAQRAILSADPVALVVASWLGTTERRIELLLASACAIVLEGAAIVGWMFVSVASSRVAVASDVGLNKSDHAGSREAIPSSREVDVPEFEAVAQGVAGAVSESSDNPVASERDLLLEKLHEAVIAGKLMPTQQGIRRFLRCGQPKAGSLNRQYAARFGSLSSQGSSTGNIIGNPLDQTNLRQVADPPCP